jgi:hypothetical protein
MDYFLMDLERTLASGVPCFWKANKHGYTYNLSFAGLFPEEVAKEIVENDLDKRTVMIHYRTVEDIFQGKLKLHEGT